MKEKFSGIIFDLDGTLIDSLEDIADSVNWVLCNLKLPEKSNAEIRQLIGDGVHVLFQNAVGIEDELLIRKAVSLFKKRYREHCVDKTKLYPEALETLDFLKNKNLAIVSNKPYEIVAEILKQLNIRDYFKIIFGEESVQHRKPHPEPILKAVEGLRVPSHAVLMVGDGTTDIEAAKRAKIFSCAVTCGYRDKEELIKLNPDYVIEKISELKKIAG